MDEICLLSDAFPPIIDGVSNAVANYAKILTRDGFQVVAAVPEYNGADDTIQPCPVIRYPGLDLRRSIGYTAGNPFNIPTLYELARRNIGILHSHCPFASNYLGRILRQRLNIPLITTYHTKYDLDISHAIHSRVLQEGAVKALVENVNAADELWVVSRGAGENIRSLGYEGDYIIMENGVDLPKKRADEKSLHELSAKYRLPDNVPVFLFVGRLMWYKGIRIILEALSALRSNRLDFRMVFIGSGTEEAEIRACADDLGLTDRCVFTGAVKDREFLSVWYSRADLFLFPSTFDTNGLVVREAAACGLGSVLVRGSSASEGVEDGTNGLLIDENSASMAVCLARIMDRKDAMRTLGDRASDTLYISWDQAVRKAAERYAVVLDNYRSGITGRHTRHNENLFSLSADLLDTYERITRTRERLEERIDEFREEHLGEPRDRK